MRRKKAIIFSWPHERLGNYNDMINARDRNSIAILQNDVSNETNENGVG